MTMIEGDLFSDVGHSFTVIVDTEFGQRCTVDVFWHRYTDTYEVKWAGLLMHQAPQALTATIQMVMLAIQEQDEPRARRDPIGDAGAHGATADQAGHP